LAKIFLFAWRGVVAELLALEEDVGAEDVLEAGLEAGPLVEEGLEEDDEVNVTTTSTGASNGLGRLANKGVGAALGRSVVSNIDVPASEVEKMYIEEDDIEDD